MKRLRLLSLVGLLVVSGCCSPLRDAVSPYVAGQSTLSVDAEPAGGPQTPTPEFLPSASPPVKDSPQTRGAQLGGPIFEDPQVRVASFQEPAQKPQPPVKSLRDLLQVPLAFPGANAPDVKMPGLNAPKEELEAAIKKYFPPLPPLPTIDPPAPGPLPLAELQRVAILNNPLVRQAVADVETARGNAVQAGLPPNPAIGYEADTMRQGNTAGLIGGYVTQTIVTAGKLKIAQLAALMDLRAAEQKLRGTQADLQTQVRQNYFNVLSAQEGLRVNLALTTLTDHMYDLLLLQLRAGIASPYEVYGVRVFTQQTRSNVVQARTRYIYAWKQLAIVVGQPQLVPTELVGRIDMAMPRYHQDAVFERVLQTHSEVLAAHAALEKARHRLKLAQVTPIPNVDVRFMLQHDFTTAPYNTVPTVQVNVPIPVWDRNQGNVQAAEAQVIRATDDLKRVELMLRNKLADAFERYETNRVQLDLYRDQILPNQVQAFRGLVTRYAAEAEKGAVNYNDLVASEQTLVSVVNTYLSELHDQWNAVTDIAGLLQTADLFQTGETDAIAPIPCMETVLPRVRQRLR